MVERSMVLEQKENGQGIVEYAMIMAFVLGIAIALFYSGIQEEVYEIFSEVTDMLGTSFQRRRFS